MPTLDRTSFVRAVVIAGLVFSAIYMYLPHLWWLAGLSAFSTGYLSLRFRDVLAAIPRALRQTSYWFDAAFYWAKTSSPLDQLIVLGGLVMASFMGWGLVISAINNPLNPPTPKLIMIFSIIVIIGFAAFFGVLVTFLLIVYGAEKGEHCFWSDTKTREEALISRGLVKKPITWPNVLRWLGKGILLTLLFFVWTWWTWCLVKFVKFTSTLIVLIHSKERVLAGIDGTVAGAVGCWFFYQSGAGLGEMAMLFVGTALIGMVIGSAHYRLAEVIRIRFAAPQAA